MLLRRGSHQIVFYASLALLLGFLLVLPSTTFATASRHVDACDLHGNIDPVSAQYLARCISSANSDGSSAVIVELDTPGGDLGSMEDMVKHLDSSKVPTIVFVYPQGAWAGSAGTFVSMAANVAAMAPGTAIGAASPVGSGGANLPSTERRKTTNFAIAYIKAQAAAHGHNANFAAAAVQSAKAIPDDQALSEHVINFVAPNLRSLLSDVNGTTVHTSSGNAVFHTKGASIQRINEDFTEQVLEILIDPNLVLILLSVGTLALIFELSNPGAILPGIVGVICIAIALFSLGTLPVNIAGLVLMAFAVVLFIADIKMPTHGFLTVGGIISFALGAVFLFSPSGNSGGPTLSPWTVVFATALMAAFFGFVVRKAVSAQKWPVKTGIQDLIGRAAVVRSVLNPTGTVFLEGETWTARSDGGSIDVGTEVTTVGVEGFTVHVVPSSTISSSEINSQSRAAGKRGAAPKKGDMQPI